MVHVFGPRVGTMQAANMGLCGTLAYPFYTCVCVIHVGGWHGAFPCKGVDVVGCLTQG